MVVAFEQQQQRVAAELHQAAPRRIRGREQVAEAGTQRLGEFFCSLMPALGQPFRQRREAGDVDEDERCVDLTPGAIRLFSRPGKGEAGEVRSEFDAAI